MKKVINPSFDFKSDGNEFLRIIWCRSIKFTTVTAVIAHSLTSDLVKLRAVFTLSSPLPRVLITIGEESVGSSNIEATEVNFSLPGMGFSTPALKDSFAHGWPV